MRRSISLVVGFSAILLALGACGGGNTVLAPQPAATIASQPFAPLQFTVLTIGQSITNGWQCPTGILTSQRLLPSSSGFRLMGVHVATGGCDDSGFPIPSPLPTPPGPTPTPLATLTTAQIVKPSFALRVPAIAGWTSILTFPACASGTCDGGTSNGAIALDTLTAASSTTFALALVFRNTGPEIFDGPTPSPSDRPAPHIYNLYGPPEPAGQPLQPVPVYVSGTPVTIAFPALEVTLPPGSPIDTTKLRLTIVQKLTPPTYEEAIYSSAFTSIPLATSSTPYPPKSSTGTTATFAPNPVSFPFQTDFTEYDFIVATD